MLKSLEPWPYFELHGGNVISEGYLQAKEWNDTAQPVCDNSTDSQIHIFCQLMGYSKGLVLNFILMYFNLRHS